MKTTILLALLLACSALRAEPTPTMLYLINEPASMLDIGLVRMRLRLFHYVSYKPGFSVYGSMPDADANYDYDQNRISIDLQYLQPLESPKQTGDMESECRRVIKQIRVLNFFNLVDFPFRHIGYAKKAEPAELQEEVDRITVIRLSFPTVAADGKPGKQFQCEGKMTEETISIVK